MLCFGLKETGVCGAPVEYFNPFTSVPAAMDEGRFEDFSAYADWVIRENTGPNGVFGVKMHRGQFHFLTGELKKMGSYQDLSDTDALNKLFGDPRYIYITRRDKVKQAVSWLIAMQTANWMEENGGQRSGKISPRYDYFALYARHRMLIQHDLLWRDFFARNHIQPLEIVYEDMIDSYPRTLERVLGHLGLDPHAARKVPAPPTKPQASPINDLWVEKYNSTPRWPGKLHQFFARAAGRLSHAS